MLRQGRPTVKSFILILATIAVATIAAPHASATVIYSVCTSGCVDTGGSYAATQAQPAAAGLSFPGSPISFTSANLNSGVYTDPATGVVFTAYNGASIDTAATVNGTSLGQGASGSGSGIQIVLPANTYALALNLTAFGGATLGIAINDQNFTSMSTTGGFLTLISDTPMSSVFIGPTGAGSFQIDDFEPGDAETPEISSLLMIATGLMSISIAPRLRRPQTKPLEIHSA
jgi:hypothetical protein